MAVDTTSELMAGEEETWALVSEGFDPLNERGAEAVFAIANGHFGVRAALEEGNPASNPMIIVAGIFVPTSGPAGQTLLTLPDPSTLFVSAETLNFSMSSVRTNSHSRTLDMREATLHRSWSFTDRHGRSWLLALAAHGLRRAAGALSLPARPVAGDGRRARRNRRRPAERRREVAHALARPGRGAARQEPLTWAKTWLFVDGKPARLDERHRYRRK